MSFLIKIGFDPDGHKKRWMHCILKCLCTNVLMCILAYSDIMICYHGAFVSIASWFTSIESERNGRQLPLCLFASLTSSAGHVCSGRNQILGSIWETRSSSFTIQWFNFTGQLCNIYVYVRYMSMWNICLCSIYVYIYISMFIVF